MVAAHGLPTETELRSLVPWARGYLCAKFGLNAVSLAETTLARAAETYDGRTQFRTWAKLNLFWAGGSDYQSLYGKPGSLKRQARADASEPTDEPELLDNPLDRMIEAEATLEQLRYIETLQGTARWIVLGRFLGDFSNTDLGVILDLSKCAMIEAMNALRESLSPR